MTARRLTLVGASLFGVLFLLVGIALAAKSYPDRLGDVKGGAGPDIASVTVSNTKTTLTFRVRFAKAPPLRVSTREGWIEMLLIGVDVPPLGPRPRAGGDWLGANFALGTHGPFTTGQLVRVGKNIPGKSRLVASFKVVTKGSSVTFSVPRSAIGNPAWFAFQAAAGRETEKESGGGSDLAPAGSTFRYTFTA